MRELNYKGVRIVQVEQPSLGHPSMNPMGFTVKYEYTTLDDFDDHALGVCYHRFWSPADACMAVDIDQWQAPQYGPKAGSWRFSYIMAMRANPSLVREALREIEDCLLLCERHDADPDSVGSLVLDRIRKLELDIR